MYKVSDDELIYLYRQGNEWAYEMLQQRFSVLILSMIRKSFIGFKNMGFDEEECIQESSICFCQSIETYSEVKSACFATYFYLRLHYMLYSYRRDLFAQVKNETTYESMNETEQMALHIANQPYFANPSKMLVYQGEMDSLRILYEKTDGIEKMVIACLMNGENSREMGKHLPFEQRKINNALYRIRKKLRIIRQ